MYGVFYNKMYIFLNILLPVFIQLKNNIFFGGIALKWTFFIWGQIININIKDYDTCLCPRTEGLV